jgi:hypothetical protein
MTGSDDEATTGLEAVDDAATTFADLPDVSPADLEDFERGIRQQRRIVLARAICPEATVARQSATTLPRYGDGELGVGADGPHAIGGRLRTCSNAVRIDPW